MVQTKEEEPLPADKNGGTDSSMSGDMAGGTGSEGNEKEYKGLPQK